MSVSSGISLEALTKQESKHSNEIEQNEECNGDADSLNITHHRPLLYTVDENPPIHIAVILGLQHYLITLGGNVGNPLLIARAMCMYETDEGLAGRAAMISTILLLSGFTTIMQTTFGIRLPTMQGTAAVFIAAAFAFLELPINTCPEPIPNTGLNGTPTLYNDTDGIIVDGTELWQRRMRQLQGGMIIGGLVEFGLGATGLVGMVIKRIGPLTVCVAIIVVGLVLTKPAYGYASTSWPISITTTTVVIGCSQYLSRIKAPCQRLRNENSLCSMKLFALFPVFFAVIIGWTLSVILTASNALSDDVDSPQYRARTDNRLSVLETTPWFRVPYPLQFGTPVFSSAGIISMLIGTIASIADSIGDYFANARVTESEHPPPHAVNRGIALEGIACMICGLMGTPGGNTTYSINSGAIGVTRVASRLAFQLCGVLMMLLAVFGKFGAFLVMIPDPVLGGLMIALLSLVVSVGFSELQSVNLFSPRNLFTVGFSIFFSMMMAQYIKANAHVINTGSKEFDQTLLILFKTPMLLGALIATFLDMTLPGKQKINNEMGKVSSARNTNTYDLPFNTTFRYSKFIPILPDYKL